MEYLVHRIRLEQLQNDNSDDKLWRETFGENTLAVQFSGQRVTRKPLMDKEGRGTPLLAVAYNYLLTSLSILNFHI